MADLKAQIEITADASGVEAGVSQGKRALKDLGEAGKKAGEEANKGIGGIGSSGEEAAQKVDRTTKNIISSIQRATAAMEAGSRGSSDYYRVIASQRGANADALKPYLDQLDMAIKKQEEAAKGSSFYSKSARETAFALRNVPAQFTDIVTSLQGGQAPLTVMLQQGGQLKDMFGGIGNAAKALGGYLMNLVSPISLAAAAAGAIGYAFYSGAEEARDLSKAIILTGNAAGSSVNDLKNMASAVAESSGATKSSVMSTLTQLVETGQVTSKTMGGVASAAIAMEKAGGQAISETVKQMAELGKEPVNASIKLNEQYRYLTGEIFSQIKALEDQGRATDAAALAQESYARAMEERAKSISGELGSLEKAWKGIVGTAKSAWDAMLGVGREGSIEERLAKARADLANGGGLFGGESEARAKVAVLEAQLDSQKKVVSKQAESNALEKAKISWLQEGEKYLNKQEQKQREIAKAKQQALAAGVSEIELNKRIAEISEKYDEKTKKPKDTTKQDHNEYLRQLKLDADTELDAIAKRNKEIKAAAEASHYLNDIQKKFTRSNEAKSDALQILPEAISRLNAELRQVDQTAEDAGDRLAKMFGDGKLTAEDYAQKVSELNTITEKQKQAVIGLNEQQNALNESWEYGAGKAMQKYADSAKNVAASAENAFSRSFSGMEDALVKFVQTGKLSFTDMVNSFIADIVRMKIRAAAASAVSNSSSGGTNWLGIIGGIAGMFGGTSATAATASALPGNSLDNFLALNKNFATNANGGVYQSPSLHQYSNQVYDTPQIFQFAKGAGIFAEAGPEAIMPLKRGADGKLGVAAQKTGNDSRPIVININSSSGDKAEIRRSAAAGARAALGAMNGAQRYA